MPSIRRFNIGDIVIGNSDIYTYTCRGWKGRVIAIDDYGNFSAESIEDPYPGRYSDLNQEYFELFSPVVYPEQLTECTYCNLNLITFDDDILYAECPECKSLYAKNGDIIAGNNITQEVNDDAEEPHIYEDENDEELEYMHNCPCDFCVSIREAYNEL